MSTAASGLKDLHQLHIQLRDVQEKLDRGPKQVKARQQFAARKQAELDIRKDRLVELKKLANQKSLQLKTNDAKIADLRMKLNTASSNREFDIIKSQIDADTMANSVLEDEILETLETADSVESELKRLEGEFETATAGAKRVAQEVAAAEPRLKEETAELESALRAAERSLPGQVATVYRRLVNAHGAGALAPVENKACTACNAILAPQECVLVNTDQIIFCRSCGRLLYLAKGD